MKLFTKFSVALFAVSLAGAALAQTGPTPRQIQGLIAQGQEQAALADLQTILQDHPQSGVAWYLTAEADDAIGNEAAAQTALNNAEQYAPGLPFAKPAAVAALQAHIANPGGSPAPYRHHGSNLVFWIIGGLAVLFIILRMGARRRFNGYRDGYGGGFPGGPQNPYPPYGPPGYGQGGGIGSTLLGGLAAGAGFAAGERIIDDIMGGNRDTGFIQNDNFGNGIPDRDDGLNGNPGWDSGSGGGNDDLDSNNW